MHVLHDEVGHGCGNGEVALRPSAFYGFPIGFPGRARAGGNGGDFKIGMIGEEGDKALPDHAGCAEDPNFELGHRFFLSADLNKKNSRLPE